MHTRRFLQHLVITLVVGLLFQGLVWSKDITTLQRKLAARVYAAYGPEALQPGRYIGAEFCLACHDYDGWRDSLHATMHAAVPDGSNSMNPALGIIFDSNNNGVDDFKDGLDFNKISSAFDPYKPNAPILSYEPSDPAGAYKVTIGPIKYTVFLKEGGFYQQRLLTRVAVTDGGPDKLTRTHYMLPFAYSPRYHTFALYNPDKWWDTASKAVKIVPGMTSAQVAGIGRSFDQKCIGCHVTGYSVALSSNGEWRASAPVAALYREDDPTYYDMNGDGNKEFINVSCESCHGPGSLHVIMYGDPKLILNPVKGLDKKQQMWLCGQCHTRGVSLPAGVHDYAYDETGNKPYQVGMDVYNFLKGEPGLWPDGKTPARGEQQFQAHATSKHFTSQSPVTCTDCHNPHSKFRKLPRQNAFVGNQLFLTDLEDNTLCLSCHAARGAFKAITGEMVQRYSDNYSAIGKVVSAHSHHPYAPERTMGLSRCTSCHMPLTGKRDYNFDETSHTMEAIPPSKTLFLQDKGGTPNSCQIGCHRNVLGLLGAQYDLDSGKWNEKTDVDLAKQLLQYFGPSGLWWKVVP